MRIPVATEITARVLNEWRDVEPQIKQSVIAEWAEVSRPTAQGWCAGKKLPPLDAFLKLEVRRAGLIDRLADALLEAARDIAR